MATIRDKLGHWPFGPLRQGGDDEFAFSLIMRIRRPPRRTVTAPGERRKALLFRPFRHSVSRRHAHAEGEVRSRLPPGCEHTILGPDEAAVPFCAPEAGHRKAPS